MGLKHDYKCPAHGFFVSREPVCPHGCTDVQPVFLQAPGMISDHTKVSGKTVRQLAIARPVVHEVRCTYPQCQATNGCVGACSKTAPVHASDMSEKHVQISDKNRHEWGSVTDDALIEEVRRRGFPIRGAQISLKIKDEYELCCQKYDTCTEPCTPRGRHLAKHEWVGLTDEEVHNAFNFVEFVKQISFDRDRPEWCKNFAAYLEAKLKEKNT